MYWTNIPNISQPEQRIYNVQDFIDGQGFPSTCTKEKRYFKKRDNFTTITASYYKGIRGYGRPAISTKEGFFDDDRDSHRMLTPEECERLQSVPVGYTDGVSKQVDIKCLGTVGLSMLYPTFLNT